MLFGTAQDEHRSFEILDHFVDAGGVWIDTANCYAFWADPTGFGGKSEEMIGRWLARRPGVRDRVRISTKVGCEPTEAGRFPETAEGLSAGAVKSGIEDSLRRLGTDHVELYWAHMPDPGTPLEETVGAFGDLVSAGTVGRLGCSNYPVWQVDRARRIARDHGGATSPRCSNSTRISNRAPRPGPVCRTGSVRSATRCSTIWSTTRTWNYGRTHRC